MYVTLKDIGYYTVSNSELIKSWPDWFLIHLFHLFAFNWTDNNWPFLPNTSGYCCSFGTTFFWVAGRHWSVCTIGNLDCPDSFNRMLLQSTANPQFPTPPKMCFGLFLNLSNARGISLICVIPEFVGLINCGRHYMRRHGEICFPKMNKIACCCSSISGSGTIVLSGEVISISTTPRRIFQALVNRIFDR